MLPTSMSNSSASSASVGVTGPTVNLSRLGANKGMGTGTIVAVILVVLAAAAIGYKLVK